MPKQPRMQYPVSLRLEVLYYAAAHGNRRVGANFKIVESVIRGWKKKEGELRAHGDGDAVRVGFAGRRPICDDMELELAAYVQQQRQQRLRVTRKELMLKADS